MSNKENRVTFDSVPFLGQVPNPKRVLRDITSQVLGLYEVQRSAAVGPRELQSRNNRDAAASNTSRVLSLRG